MARGTTSVCDSLYGEICTRILREKQNVRRTNEEEPLFLLKYFGRLATLSFAGLLILPTCRAQSPSSFVAVRPCRIVDTRNPAGPLGGPAMSAASMRSFPIPSGSCGIPITAAAYSINVAVLPFGPLGYLALWPTGQSQPLVATMSSQFGQIVGNAAIVPAGTNGAINVYVTDLTHIIIDLNGYFAPATNSITQSTAVGNGASAAGGQNTAVGFDTLQVNTGNSNTALGAGVLPSNTSGNNNVGVGAAALTFNASGSANTAIGSQAMLNTLIGNDNSSLGYSTLWSNTTGGNNTAVGAQGLFSNTSGSYNTAVGESSLYTNTDGSWNVAVGYQAGSQISTGSYNIEIGNQGVSGDSNTIRLGSAANQTSAFIAGISNVNISSGSTVLINSNGQLGTVQSSRRYKDEIREMGQASEAVMQLHPVMFRYKQAAADGTRPLQYGLIGEEVANVYPELVVHGLDGRIESVQYHELPALLLNELQKQHKVLEKQEQELEEARKAIATQREQIESLKSHVATLGTALSALKGSGTN